MKRRLFLVAAAGVLCAPAIAHAHAMLLRAEPAVGSTVAVAPTVIRLSFSQPVDAARCTIELYGPDGAAVPLGALSTSDGGTVLTAAMDVSLGAGRYRVHWHATNTEGHETSGDFEFQIAA